MQQTCGKVAPIEVILVDVVPMDAAFVEWTQLRESEVPKMNIPVSLTFSQDRSYRTIGDISIQILWHWIGIVSLMMSLITLLTGSQHLPEKIAHIWKKSAYVKKTNTDVVFYDLFWITWRNHHENQSWQINLMSTYLKPINLIYLPETNPLSFRSLISSPSSSSSSSSSSLTLCSFLAALLESLTGAAFPWANLDVLTWGEGEDSAAILNCSNSLVLVISDGVDSCEPGAGAPPVAWTYGNMLQCWIHQKVNMHGQSYAVPFIVMYVCPHVCGCSMLANITSVIFVSSVLCKCGFSI